MSDREKKKAFERKYKVPYISSDNNTGPPSPPPSASDGGPTKGSRQRAFPEEIEIESSDVRSFSAYRILNEDKIYLQKVLSSEAQNYNLTPPSIEFRYLPVTLRGYFNLSDYTIYLNENEGMFEDFFDGVKTVIHEMRHCYQYDVMINPQKHPEVPPSLANYLTGALDSYKKDKEKHKTYFKNALEVDARAFSAARVEDYHSIDFDTLTHLPLERFTGNQILRTPNQADSYGNPPPINTESNYKKQNDNAISERKEKNMGGRDTIDISEDAQRKALQFYAEVIENIQQETENTVMNMCDQVKKHPYLQTQNATNVFIHYYNSDLPQGLKKVIDTWKESGASINSYVRRVNGGEEAEHTARKLEEGILKDVFSNFKNIDEVNVDVSGMKINTDAINESANIVCSSVKKMETYEQDITSKINSLVEDNTIYQSISFVVASTFSFVNSALGGTVDSLRDLSEEYANAIKQNLGEQTPPPPIPPTDFKKRRRHL